MSGVHGSCGSSSCGCCELVEELQCRLALLTPVCVPTTGEPKKLQRTLSSVTVTTRGRDTAINLHFTGRAVYVPLSVGMTQDHVIRALADLCIEVAK